VKLYLMQHGRPLPEEQDPTRPLSPDGIREVEAMAAWLAQVGIRVRAVFHSPKTRARETAQRVFRMLPHGARLEERLGLAPMDDPRMIIDEIAAGSEALMLVGHLPHLGRLATWLLTNGAREEPSLVRFRQGAVLCLAREEGHWSVAWMVTPELLSS